MVTLGGADTHVLSYANSMEEAAQEFAAGNYKSTALFELDEKQQVELGLEGTHELKQSWFILGPFTLEKFNWTITTDEEWKNYFSETSPSENMSSDAKTELSKAESTFKSAPTFSNYSAYLAAVETAKASVKVYATLADAINTYTEKATAKGTSVAEYFKKAIDTIQTSYDEGTYSDEEIPAAITEVVNAYKEAIKLVNDYTGCIVNPDFSDNTSTAYHATPYGWTVGGVTAQNYWHVDNKAGVMETWSFNASSNTFDLYQEVTGLPAGVYRISANMFNYLNGQSGTTNGAAGLYAQCGEDISYAGIVESEDSRSSYSVLISVAEGETLRLGAKNMYLLGARWFTADDFTLIYLGADYSTVADDEAAVTCLSDISTTALALPMNGDVKAAATSAVEAFNNDKTMANYEAAQKALAAAYASIALYQKSSDQVTFNEKAVEDHVYYATYTTTTAVNLDDCKFTAYSVSVDGTSVKRTALSGVVPANTPLLLSATQATTYYAYAVMSEEESTAVTTNLKSSDGTVVGNERTIYTLNLYDGVLGWYLKQANVAIAAGKCYLQVEDANGAKFLGFSDDTTGINAVSNDTKQGVRYNVSGQRVGNDYKGIVIENGKKYLVK